MDFQLYIVYLGHKPHDDHELITDSHHDILSQVVGSKKEAKSLMLYSYRHSFSGFAAKLTDSKAEQIGELPGVVRVIQNSRYKAHTSRSWDFLGLSNNDSSNLLNKTKQGDGIIIGVLDTGIWGGMEAFNDRELGPIPSRWKGLMEEKGLNQTMVEKLYDLSPIDDMGHGTHVAYTAAGSYVNTLDYYGLNMGTVRGGAPFARIAMHMIFGADILASIDDAIKDRVDVLSTSIGNGLIKFAEVHVGESLLGLGSFHAVSHGIPFITSAGNSGPDSNTLNGGSPWVISVAASNEDREIVTPIILGNNKTILGQGVYNGKGEPFAPLITFGNITSHQEVQFIAKEVAGKVLLLFLQGQQDIIPSFMALQTTPGVNILAAVPPPIGEHGFQVMSGTSMATPHVSAIVALLKVAHPNWSPAAFKSALVTTAWNEDTYKSEIFSEGIGDKLADPFDFGGGICNPNGAMDPGLIYDMDKNDYVNYLYSLGYSNNKIQNATTYISGTNNSTEAGVVCPNQVPSRLDLNLPSISIPDLKNSVTVKRTVTNVGDVNFMYKLVVKSPRNTAIKVNPEVLKFNLETKKISFEVTITSILQRKSKFTLGSLAWTDDKYFVRIPIAVRK
ncbi:hypothetical protein HAX54_027633 [Datura stramonium]|uniref:Uncharacterized protein n=1 Tax=Datura stramonium TaxID=4076 RepID=A0ABS8V2Z6_DATST|nr:hypothetical protein [Datura stramonium]